MVEEVPFGGCIRPVSQQQVLAHSRTLIRVCPTKRDCLMPRIRTIKPEFPQSESMGRVSREARLCFVLLWTLADDSGRLRGNSRMLASLLFPYDNDASSLIDGWLLELEKEQCIVRYQIEGSAYLEICKWLNHQKIDKPSQSKIPPPSESSRILANVLESSPLDQGRDQGPKDQVPKERKPAKPSAIACPQNVNESTWNDWLALRKAKRAPVTQTVIDHAEREAEKAGLTLDAFLKIWCARGSQGLEASWLKPDERQKATSHTGFAGKNYSEGIGDDGRIL